MVRYSRASNSLIRQLFLDALRNATKTGALSLFGAIARFGKSGALSR